MPVPRKRRRSDPGAGALGPPRPGRRRHRQATVAWGPGPRASQALTLCARARALYDGRLAPSVDDVRALAEPVLQHRMALTFAARAEGISVRDVVARLVKGV
jgi:MoxR-like ATPase